jgi:hypothetical protein
MPKIKYFALLLLLKVCAGNVAANYANAASPAEKIAPAAPTKDGLMTLEKSAYEAWKSKDPEFWDTYLSDKFVGYGSSGKLDKASAIKEYTGADCDIKSYALSDEQMKPIGDHAALITYKTTVDGICDGQKLPAQSRAASVYAGESNRWKLVFHAEDAVFDPNAVPAKPAGENEAIKRDQTRPDATDANTEAMLAVERPFWEAWRTHNAGKLEAAMARDTSFINIFGTYFPTKTEALKDWTGTGCDVKSVSVTGATSTMLSARAGILTFTGTAVGTCYGQKIESAIWGTSIYVKDGDAWKWTFGINVPAQM